MAGIKIDSGRETGILHDLRTVALPLVAASALFLGGCSREPAEPPTPPWPTCNYPTHATTKTFDNLYALAIRAHSQLVSFSHEPYVRRTDSEGYSVADRHELNPQVMQSLRLLRSELHKLKGDFPVIRNSTNGAATSTGMTIMYLSDAITVAEKSPRFLRTSEGWEFSEEFLTLENCKKSLDRLVNALQGKE